MLGDTGEAQDVLTDLFILRGVPGYLHELTDGFKAERVTGDWITFYNTERPHSSLDGQTPAEAYAGLPVDMMDKPDGLPTSPQAQQQQQNVINRVLAA